MNGKKLRDRQQTAQHVKWLWPLMMLAIAAGLTVFAGFYWSGSE